METFTLKLPKQWSLTDDEFYDFCQENDAVQLERNAHGEILIYRATGPVVRWQGYQQTISGEDVLPDFTFDLRWLR